MLCWEKIFMSEEASQNEAQTIVVVDFKTQIAEIKNKYLKFLFIPGARDENLIQKELLMSQYKSKRKKMLKINPRLAILGIFLIFLVLTWAVFVQWILGWRFLSLTDGTEHYYRLPV